jgi:hypothetical protein
MYAGRVRSPISSVAVLETGNGPLPPRGVLIQASNHVPYAGSRNPRRKRGCPSRPALKSRVGRLHVTLGFKHKRRPPGRVVGGLPVARSTGSAVSGFVWVGEPRPVPQLDFYSHRVRSPILSDRGMRGLIRSLRRRRRRRSCPPRVRPGIASWRPLDGVSASRPSTSSFTRLQWMPGTSPGKTEGKDDRGTVSGTAHNGSASPAVEASGGSRYGALQIICGLPEKPCRSSPRCWIVSPS